jgi:hypothetical protein
MHERVVPNIEAAEIRFEQKVAKIAKVKTEDGRLRI